MATLPNTTGHFDLVNRLNQSSFTTLSDKDVANAKSIDNNKMFVLGVVALSTQVDPLGATAASSARVMTPINRDVNKIALWIDSGPLADGTSTGEVVQSSPVIHSRSIQWPLSATPVPFTVAGRRRWATYPDTSGVLTDTLAMPMLTGATPKIRSYKRMLLPPTPSVSAVSGGSLTAGTYYIKIAARCCGAESILSSEVTATTASTNLSVQVSWTGQNRDDEQIAIYIGTSSGSNKLIATVPPTNGSYTITSLLGQGNETGITANSVAITRANMGMNSAGEFYTRNLDPSDYTQTTAMPTVGYLNGQGDGPIDLLVADYENGANDPCIGVLGDSILFGFGLASTIRGTYGYGLGGSAIRAIWERNKESGFAHAISGTRVSSTIDGTSKSASRLAKMSFAKTRYSEWGVNDFSNNRTWQQLASDHITLSRIMGGGVPLRLYTICPATSDTTDYCMTIAGQIPRSNFQETQRLTYNTWIRNGSQVDTGGNPVLTGGLSSPYIDSVNFFDAAALVEVNSSNILTLNGGYWQVPTAPIATYTITAVTGFATPGASGTLAVAGTPFPTGSFTSPSIGTKVVKIITGSQAGQLAVVNTNTSNVITTWGGNLSGYTNRVVATSNPISAPPQVGDQFELWAPLTCEGLHPSVTGHTIEGDGFKAHLFKIYG